MGVGGVTGPPAPSASSPPSSPGAHTQQGFEKLHRGLSSRFLPPPRRSGPSPEPAPTPGCVFGSHWPGPGSSLDVGTPRASSSETPELPRSQRTGGRVRTEPASSPPCWRGNWTTERSLWDRVLGPGLLLTPGTAAWPRADTTLGAVAGETLPGHGRAETQAAPSRPHLHCGSEHPWSGGGHSGPEHLGGGAALGWVQQGGDRVQD